MRGLLGWPCSLLSTVLGTMLHTDIELTNSHWPVPGRSVWPVPNWFRGLWLCGFVGALLGEGYLAGASLTSSITIHSSRSTSYRFCTPK